MADVATQIEALEQKAVTLKRQVNNPHQLMHHYSQTPKTNLSPPYRKNIWKPLKNTKKLSCSKETPTESDLKP